MTNTRTQLNPGEKGYEIRGGVFSDKVLTLGATDFHDVIIGGAKFDDCEFRMKRVTKTDFNFDATCINCDFRLPKRVANRYMNRPILDSCRFHGHFVGFDFGPKFLQMPFGPSHGSLRNCDFSTARLHLCAFYETSPRDHKLPGWPHVYLDYTQGSAWALELAKAPVPDRFKIVLKLNSDENRTDPQVRPCQFLSIYLPELECDPEAMWPLIQDIPQIWFPEKEAKERASAAKVAEFGENNQRAAATAARDRDRLAIFNFMHRCWLLECQAIDERSAIDLVFDTSMLRKRVSDAPLQVRVRLEGATASLRMGTGVEPLRGHLDKFMVTSAVLEGDTVLLKPHRKERGQVLLDFSGYTAFDEAGGALKMSDMLEYVKRYWSTGF